MAAQILRAPVRRFVPTFDILEDRLVIGAVGPQPGPTNWRDFTFQINDQFTAASTAVGTATAQDMQDAQLIGLDQTFANYSYRGTGYTVAVIDTGIDYNNPALGGGWGKRVIGGWNFVANDSNPMDDNGHGTFVAGVIGSSDATYKGIAPNVNFVALKVLDATGTGTFGNVDLALQWVAAHQAQYNIVAVNMSLGAGDYTTEPFNYLDADFTALQKQGVFVAVAAGNDYYTYGSQQGLAFPAVNSSVVSVGAIWDGNYGAVTWVNGAQDYTTAPGLITSFTERDANLDILAPGAMLTSETLNNQFATEAGTSMSTPVIAGAAVLIHQALDALGKHSLTDQQDILSIMQQTGTSVTDGTPAHDNVTNTGLTFKSLNLFAALNSLGSTPSTPSSPSTPTGPSLPPVFGSLPDQTMTAGTTLTITLPATDPSGLTIQFSVQAGSSASQAYVLRQQFGLAYAGSYFLNSYGANEKWLLGSGAQWYCITPDGELHHFVDTMANALLPANLVASLGAAYYNDPSLLYAAAAPSAPPVTLSIAGDQLSITAPATYTGTFPITVTANDGQASAMATFQVTVASAPPQAAPNQPAPAPSPSLGTITFNSGLGTGTITLSAATGTKPTYTAGLGGSSLQAVQLQKSLGLFFLGGYFQNLDQKNEKWLGGANGQLYFLLPSGELHRYVGNFATSLGAKYLVATLDKSFYANPQLLLKPMQPTFKIVGNQLTVQFPKGFLGSFVVQVSAKVGTTVTVQTFNVTVANQASGTSVSMLDVSRAVPITATASFQVGSFQSVSFAPYVDAGPSVVSMQYQQGPVTEESMLKTRNGLGELTWNDGESEVSFPGSAWERCR